MPSSVTYSGWGNGAWGQTSWGTDLTAVIPDGVAGTTAVGSVTILSGITVSVTGVAGTATLGTVTTDADSVVIEAV